MIDYIIRALGCVTAGGGAVAMGLALDALFHGAWGVPAVLFAVVALSAWSEETRREARSATAQSDSRTDPDKTSDESGSAQ